MYEIQFRPKLPDLLTRYYLFLLFLGTFWSPPKLVHSDVEAQLFHLFSGRDVQCYHLTNGVLIRADDFEDLLTFVHQDLTGLEGKDKNSRGGVLGRNSSALLIRSLWPSQSWAFITSFRATNTRRIPPFHTVRFDAAKCKYYSFEWNIILKALKTHDYSFVFIRLSFFQVSWRRSTEGGAVREAKKNGRRRSLWIQSGWPVPKSRSGFGTWSSTPTSPGRSVWQRSLGPLMSSCDSMLESPWTSR